MSNETKHTPGPWKVKYFTTQNHRYSYKINAASGQETDEEALANSILIASAPDLLKENQELKDAIKNFVHFIKTWNDNSMTHDQMQTLMCVEAKVNQMLLPVINKAKAQ